MIGWLECTHRSTGHRHGYCVIELLGKTVVQQMVGDQLRGKQLRVELSMKTGLTVKPMGYRSVFLIRAFHPILDQDFTAL